MSDPAGLIPVRAKVIANLVEDLKLDENRTRTLGEPSAPPSSQARNSIVGVAASVASPADLAPAIRAIAARETSADGTLLVAIEGERDEAALAALRNALWPEWHVGAIYRTRHRQITRVTLAGTSEVGRGAGFQGLVLVARPRAAVFAPDVTVEKFDKNATGWNGDPSSKGYAHFRWMRRYVGTFADAREARRILDFGCGAGWVGIEASLAARAQSKSEPELFAFDPSPEMVKLFEENAAASGLTRAVGRTGFGEDPPFPASGEPRFDLVISSGVISFSGDQERWLDGLARTLLPGATLVIGDIHRESKGMRRRRLTRPLCPCAR
jgi:SAM-dependent methyltransferase